MEHFHKYLTISEKDEQWGLYLLNAGFTKIPPGSSYPPHPHPDDHYFQWETGRKLREYQVILITQGEGKFESAHCPCKMVSEGSVIFLYPGEWHRYRPANNTGWNEYWVGFDGKFASQLLGDPFFDKKQPILKLKDIESLLTLYQNIFERVSHEKPGYQQICAGLVQQLLAIIWSTLISKSSEDDTVDPLIKKVKGRIMENLKYDPNWHQMASHFNVSYPWLRKIFKERTGLSLHQYLLQLRIKQARHLLVSNNEPVKVIAHQTGFESSYYFSRMFKQKTGLTPREFRVESRGG